MSVPRTRLLGALLVPMLASWVHAQPAAPATTGTPPGPGAPPAPAAASTAPSTAPGASPGPAPSGRSATAPAGGTTPAATSAAAGGADPLAAFAWLQGCWRGTVNQREFREQWLPAAGGMMIGAGHTVMQGRTQDFEYLRLEARPDGLRYVTVASGQTEATFRFEGASRDEINPADIFTFANATGAYPQRIVYRHGGEGWLYAQVEGSINGAPRNVTYPMRHVDCESGEVLHK